MQQPPSKPPICSRLCTNLSSLPSALKTVCAYSLFTCVVAFIVCSCRWPLVGDAPLFHYIVFLMQHGFAPYRRIHDINLPGTYAFQYAVISLFGPGALAWRIWDLLLLAAIALCMYALCRPRSRFAPVFAASLFALIHGRDGITQLGQRDLLLTALVLLGYAGLFRIMRRPAAAHWSLSALPGLALATAATVKPQALLLILGLLPFMIRSLRGTRPVRSHLTAYAAGTLLPVAAAVGFLVRWRAWPAFTATMLHLVPLHAAILRRPPHALLVGSVSSVVLPMFLVWLVLFIQSGRWRDPETQALLVGFAFGVFSYCVQGRGYPYHRYPSEAFLLLLIAIEFSAALTAPHILRKTFAACGILFGVLVVAPRSLAEIRGYNWQSDEFGHALQHDFVTIGRTRLNGRVQCLDMAGGCINALYRARLVQSTGYLYDCYLFIPARTSAQQKDQRAYRRAFLAALERTQPNYLIVTSDECGLTHPDFAYRKLSEWQPLQTLIQNSYYVADSFVPTRKEGWEGQPVLPYGFRIYQRMAHR